MEQVRTIIVTACMLSIAVGICSILRPSKAFDRQVQFLISLLFVIGIAEPLLRTDWRMPPVGVIDVQMQEQSENLTTEAQNLILAETASQCESALYDLLTQQGITCEEMDVSVHIDEEACIYISEVSAVCSDAEASQAVLREKLGEEVTIHVTEPASQTLP